MSAFDRRCLEAAEAVANYGLVALAKSADVLNAHLSGPDPIPEKTVAKALATAEKAVAAHLKSERDGMAKRSEEAAKAAK